MQNQAGPPEDRSEESRQRRSHFAELREDEHLLLLGGNHLGDIAQARPFAAVVFAPHAVSQPLRRVVADLLEAHQERQYQPLALDALGFLELRGQFFTACS